MNLVCGITTKNEDWIIDKTLSILIKFCDKIVIYDDNSTDNTKKICQKYDKVNFIKRKPRKNIWDREEAKGLKELFDIVSSYNPKFILFLDADEIPTPSFITFFKELSLNSSKFKNIEAWSTRMINLHKDEEHYRTDHFQTKTILK